MPSERKRSFIPIASQSLKGFVSRYQVKNSNKKRVCDISIDNTTAYIRKGDCVTEIHATNSGTLCVSHKLDSNVS